MSSTASSQRAADRRLEPRHAHPLLEVDAGAGPSRREAERTPTIEVSAEGDAQDALLGVLHLRGKRQVELEGCQRTTDHPPGVLIDVRDCQHMGSPLRIVLDVHEHVVDAPRIRRDLPVVPEPEHIVTLHAPSLTCPGTDASPANLPYWQRGAGSVSCQRDR